MTTDALAPAPADVAAELRAVADDAVALADRWSEATHAGETKAEAATTGRLAALLADPAGLDLAVRFVDRVARPEDDAVAARELARITSSDAASFLGVGDRALLGLGAKVARLAPRLVVPAARMRMRQMVGHLVVDVRDPHLGTHLAAAREDGFRLNINLLGEAVLGEEEASSRTERTRRLLARDDVDYVSIKVSSLVSQIITWDTEGTIERCLERLRPLYRTAAASSPRAFVNLDMEEYRDLDLTLEVFTRMLSEPEFHDLEAGIVLQAYLPDAMPALERLVDFAQQRRAAGGAPIKVRLVKGANLAMERVEARMHDWTQAPYGTKAEVDASYLRCVERALRPDVAGALRLGVASHNLYDVATAHLLAERRGVSEHLDVEMLQGMSPSQARAVRDTVGTVILYTPVVDPRDFDSAVSYLVRRLEENAAPENFLHSFFAEGSAAMSEQEARYRRSVEDAATVGFGARREDAPATITATFSNTPDADPALPSVRARAGEAVDQPLAELTSPHLGSTAEIDGVVATAAGAQAAWAERPAAERAELLLEAARSIESRRDHLLAVMAAEGGKTVAEADPEISEAVDFARYYADSALALEDGPMTDGATFAPDRVVLVTPPWNFPLAIPLGGVLAALAAGSAVIIKPAPQTPRIVEAGVAALHDAGIPQDVLQVVRTEEDEVGRSLIAHADIETVVLTGASETARLFAGWRDGRERGPRVYGETSGKNALIVTPAADIDLAVADLVHSAFGHAGQKCSAASLAILVGSVADSDRFRRQLVDAVRSIRVGWPRDLGTRMGPVIEAPGEKLHRALTTLEPGETWLVEPEQLDDSGRLWSPGLKEGVAPGSFFHLTEVFGPVLGLMRADTLDEAITLQNATDFGLTGGLHSLDEDEIATWTERAEVGNAYVNRHITGAIVQRQSFGGWKGSSIGPGAKAGGPSYVAQLGSWVADGQPSATAPVAERVQRVVDGMLERLDERVDVAERGWLAAALGSDAQAWAQEIGVEHDPSALVVETNVFRYRPLPLTLVRAGADARPVEVVRLVAAAVLAATPVAVSADPSLRLPASLAHAVVSTEDEAAFVARAQRRVGGGRVRLVGVGEQRGPLLDALAAVGVDAIDGEVLATGRRELLSVVREQAVSTTRHRFGHVAADRSAP
ncbi:bifunctional proline dehydrogenase/L-glutamate gamma-semialdehyde dehydrogenase [Janibacter alkaliphilus]|uniref:L-glutamate gamma-semialdehyde dehydrogenase n=1 Tax=Janibacter alkaliphilus TaxID=1069963 RepID=A0A852WZD2_9MICO|nr:bifunctional proline dehydrogenase/L-glutamate gamma-semialdehyde dehydrogenase [Janibacter alkaliphilus]NYG35568.1 RHH-type proline utilization regulon transcriptional repressor/proline dehydrogenase/delta 1-pyrroline-5-carboxylate dehydrogenase [Janibacter alkaliphilus]